MRVLQHGRVCAGIPHQHQATVPLSWKEVAGEHAAFWKLAVGTGSRHIEAEWLDELAGSNRDTRCEVELDKRVVDQFLGGAFERRMELKLEADTDTIGQMSGPSRFDPRHLEVLNGVFRLCAIDASAREAGLQEDFGSGLELAVFLVVV